MTVGVVDIGTNSIRLLITDGVKDLQRLEEVTGLGSGVDSTGVLAEPRIVETLVVLNRYGRLLDDAGVSVRKAIATSASRDAENREAFFDRVEEMLDVRPTLITGQEEARFAYQGAVRGFEGPGPVVVSDIGGGSTEFVTEESGISIDIGSVRITERAIPDRPAPRDQVAVARATIGQEFSALPTIEFGSLIGVAGTWTSLASVARALPRGTPVHGREVTRAEVGRIVDIMAQLTVEETSDLPGLDPKRAPVILGGILVAEGVMDALGADSAVISEHDTLDGVAMALLALP
ncbi:MAG TPA: exopolyphosphatase [Acidimicrobiia bacterium]|nr:exopolyphosphatase [Acidimicrobiia bacterium]